MNKEDEIPYPTGASVPFPYESPYPQQVDLMDAMLSSLKQDDSSGTNRVVMLLESPTGTGKSLSLACAAMTWLRYQQECDLNSMATASNDKDDTLTTGVDWLDAWTSPEESQNEELKMQVLKRAKTCRKALEEELTELRRKLQPPIRRERRENLVRSAVTAAKMVERKQARRKRPKTMKHVQQQEPEDFCVTDYTSEKENDDDDDDSLEENVQPQEATSHAFDLLDGSRLDGSKECKEYSVANVKPGSGLRKIVYTARTHSQLSQFVGELRRTRWGSNVRVVALGGRQVLCGNTELRRKLPNSEAAISEACLDLQKSKTTSCPLLASREATSTLALHMLAQPCDIEDAARLGEASHTCAYYASRVSTQRCMLFESVPSLTPFHVNLHFVQESLAAAEVVVLPYSTLLMQQARQAVGLSLKESLVIVDEAHNLPEALRGIHSSRVSLPVAEAALAQLTAYTERYSLRLAGRNLYYLGQIRKCLNAFVKHLKSKPNRNQGMISPAELLIQLRLDSVNLFKILTYLEQSRLPQKLLGFTTVQTKQAGGKNGISAVVQDHDGQALSKHVSAMSIVQSFLEKLTSTSKEGKIVTDWPPPAGIDQDSRSKRSTLYPTLRYVLLHPSEQFQNVLDEAHAVVLVGGTLSPFAHVAAELLGTDFVDRAAQADSMMKADNGISKCIISPGLTAFTCDHVVPSCNVQLECLSMGPSNVKLDFRHQSRMTNPVCDEIGRALEGICKVVPSGIVVFLPSYTYEAHLVRRWKTTGLLQSLQRYKKVHREPKSSQQVELALQGYSRDATSTGALLLSVVGGKMSEGINFANDMARCVMVVGLPYPDITDPELKEKMSAMDAAAAKNSSSISGQAYYQNLCMRAVNQSVGRAIRHANDYASIVLADFRYSTDPRVMSSLPRWLRRGSANGEGDKSFSGMLSRLTAFFDDKKATTDISTKE
jgi:chromosome transmission fidelity protein 1